MYVCRDTKGDTGYRINSSRWAITVYKSTKMLFDLACNSTSNSTRDHPYMPIIGCSYLASQIMIACPNLLGSLLRIPAAILMERFSTRTLHLVVMIISLFGTLGLMIISFATQHMRELGLGIYFGYLIFGTIGGVGRLVIYNKFIIRHETIDRSGLFFEIRPISASGRVDIKSCC